MVAASSSTILNPPPLPDGEGEGHDTPNWILLDVLGYIAECPNASFAQSSTSTGQRIEVSFCTARPPHVSQFCVHCPGLGPADFSLAPTVISSEADLILFCVSAHPRSLVLELLPHPYPHRFREQEVALLSLGDDGGEYAIAILTSRCLMVSLKEDGMLNETEFDLCMYRSSRAQEGWTSNVVSVADPLRDAVCPTDCAPYHETTKVITLGHGMVCWVDLWRGILLCNVLEENPLLVDIPLPLPSRGNWRLYHKCLSYKYRDITVSPLKDVIKYIEIEVCPPQTLLTSPILTGIAKCAVTSGAMHLVRAGKPRHGAYRPPRFLHGRTGAMIAPSMLLTSMSNQSILSSYLGRVALATTSPKQHYCNASSLAFPEDQMEVVIAVDMSKKTLQGVAKLVFGKDFTDPRICTSEISKYLNKDEVAR
uniref:Uncharacterized protein n=1 Tax=Aegilops tauschii TaxID=37682 RepID=M8AUU8_AEGTA